MQPGGGEEHPEFPGAGPLRRLPPPGDGLRGARVVPLHRQRRGHLRLEVGGPEQRGAGVDERVVGGAEEGEGLEEDGLLGGDGADEMVAVGEEGVGPELEGEGGGDRGEEEVGPLEVGLGVVEVVGVVEEEGGGAEAGADLDEREEGEAPLEDRLHALDRRRVLAGVLGLVRQGPKALHHCVRAHASAAASGGGGGGGRE